jgi:hypothetical protein
MEGDDMAKRKKSNLLEEFFEKHPLVRQRDLAELWGVSTGWISMLATGKREMPRWLPYALGARQTAEDLRERLWRGES